MTRDGSAVAVSIPAAGCSLPADFTLPEDPAGVVVFAHGTGSGRHSPRNRFVADALVDGGLGALLLDLLTEDEERAERGGEFRFDIGLLAGRLSAAVGWLSGDERAGTLPVGLFGASTGAAAALVLAAREPERVNAVVSRGGRPDLAADALTEVRAPTLLIVGARDESVLDLNRGARERLAGDSALEIVPGAGHLFEEPGALERVAELSRDWLLRNLAPAAADSAAGSG